MSDDDYGTGLRNVIELQREFDELQNILFEHMQASSLMTERERQLVEHLDAPPRHDKGAEQ